MRVLWGLIFWIQKDRDFRDFEISLTLKNVTLNSLTGNAKLKLTLLKIKIHATEMIFVIICYSGKTFVRQ